MKTVEQDLNTTVRQGICHVCGNSCVLDAYIQDEKVVRVEGNRTLPGQKGSVCVKGAALRQYLYNPDRIRYPMKRVGPRGSGKFERISWEEAYHAIGEGLGKVKETYGPQATVFYVGHPKWFRGPLLRLANAYGSPNYCTESSTCYNATVLAWRSIFGMGTRPLPGDLKACETLMVWSANPAASGTQLAKDYLDALERGAKVICVDPRRTWLAEKAHLHLQLRPGTDGALALAMAHVIIHENLYDGDFVRDYTAGFEGFRAFTSACTPQWGEEQTGVPKEDIIAAARLYGGNKPAAIQLSACSPVHHINGVQNYRAVFMLIALTGNYDVPGGNHGPVKPQAVLGEQVHFYKRFSGIEAIGEKEFPHWFELIRDEAQCVHLADVLKTGKPYPVKGMLAFGMNHMMWPQPDELLEAYKELDFFAHSDLFWNKACDYADIVLPAAASFEREIIETMAGDHVVYFPPVVRGEGETRNDIQIIMDLAKEMKLKDDILNLPTLSHYFEKVLEPTGLTLAELKAAPTGLQAKKRVEKPLGSYKNKPFETPSGKVEFQSSLLEDIHGGYPQYVAPLQDEALEKQYPFVLNTGSRKAHLFHSRMYRIPWIANLEETAVVEIHPGDAAKAHIRQGDLVRVTTPAASLVLAANLDNRGKPGVVYIYHGNGDLDANKLVHKDHVDPISGFPGYKSYCCQIDKVDGGGLDA